MGWLREILDEAKEVVSKWPAGMRGERVKTLEYIGGPLDGRAFPTPPLEEGEAFAIDAKPLYDLSHRWSAEVVYVLSRGKMHYDEAETVKRNGSRG